MDRNDDERRLNRPDQDHRTAFPVKMQAEKMRAVKMQAEKMQAVKMQAEKMQTVKTQAAKMQAVKKRTERALRLTEDLIFPRRCPVCDRPVRPFGALICTDCEQLLRRVGGPVCRRCGKPVKNSAAGLCMDCRTLPHLYDRGCAVFTYHSAAGGLFRFKYQGRQEYAAYYGRCMAERLMESAAGRQSFQPETVAGRFGSVRGTATETGTDQLWESRRDGIRPGLPDLLVPVPIAQRRLEKRGYNQALLLAREISRLTGIPVAENVLRRVSDTLPMKKMTPAERQNNLKKAFQAFGNDVELKSLMLIDDIYTTGATMDACAHALYGQGARQVCFVTLAIGEER